MPSGIYNHKPHSKETRKKIGAPKIGKSRSKETKKKISETLKRKKIMPIKSKQIDKKISEALKGKKLSKEHTKKISNTLKMKYKLKLIINPNKGIPMKESTKEKLSKKLQGKSCWCKGLKLSKEKYPNLGWRTSRKNQILPKKDTSIEVKIQNFLKKLGIEYFTHQYLKIEHGYQCDILIPSMNLVIECDGDYWHKYPVGNDIDHIRTKELINKGFKVLRLWEYEIKVMELNDFKGRLNG